MCNLHFVATFPYASDSFTATKKVIVMPDTQSKRDATGTLILAALDRVSSWCKIELNRRLLGLDDGQASFDVVNAAASLERLRRSLDQYLDRRSDLVYVGFMGHFSSGKSSTINSLLGLRSGNPNARNVGLHPTDKGITLLTHPNNQHAVVAMGREGQMPVRIVLHECVLLERIVLIDTPGSG